MNALLLTTSPYMGADLKVDATGAPSYQTQITAVNALTANRGISYGFRCNMTGSLKAYVNANTTNIMLMDTNGNVLVSTFNTTTTLTQLYNITKGNQYYIFISFTAAITAGTLLAGFQLTTTPSVSNYFNGGFITTNPLPTGITATYDTYGQVTYNFTNVPVTANTSLSLGYTGIATQVGFINFTSSDTTTFATTVSDQFQQNIP